MSHDMLYYVGVKAIIRNSQNRILLLQIPRRGSTKTYWDLPGGRVKDGEDLTQALQREVEEETSIRDLAIERFTVAMVTPIRLKATNGTTAGLFFVVYKATTATIDIVAEPGVTPSWLTSEEAAAILEKEPNIPPEIIAQIKNNSELRDTAPVAQCPECHTVLEAIAVQS